MGEGDPQTVPLACLGEPAIAVDLSAAAPSVVGVNPAYEAAFFGPDDPDPVGDPVVEVVPSEAEQEFLRDVIDDGPGSSGDHDGENAGTNGDHDGENAGTNRDHDGDNDDSSPSIDGATHVDGSTVEREVGGDVRAYRLRWVQVGEDRGSLLYVPTGESSAREAELRRSRERYRRLLETSPSPIFIYTVDKELVYANEAAIGFLGADSFEEIAGTTAGDFTHPDDEDTVDDRGERLVEDREPVPPIEERLVDVDGRTKHGIVASAPVVYEGEPAIQTVVTDITPQKHRERELERHTERVETLASIVSHDLQNPLNVAQGYLDLVRDGGDADDDEALATVEESLDRMEEIVGDMLTLMQADGDLDDRVRIELSTIATRCWGSVPTDDGEVVLERDGSFTADPDQLRHVFENLFRNAVEHGADDGVTVWVGALADGFYVEDDGPGIPADEADAVFDPTHTTAEDGTGYGLAIVREIVTAHGWTVDVETGRTGGARFVVTGVDDVHVADDEGDDVDDSGDPVGGD